MILNGVLIAFILRFSTEFHSFVGRLCDSGWRQTYNVCKILSPSSSRPLSAEIKAPCSVVSAIAEHLVNLPSTQSQLAKYTDLVSGSQAMWQWRIRCWTDLVWWSAVLPKSLFFLLFSHYFWRINVIYIFINDVVKYIISVSRYFCDIHYQQTTGISWYGV